MRASKDDERKVQVAIRRDAAKRPLLKRWAQLRSRGDNAVRRWLIQRRIARAITARFVLYENLGDLRMPDRLARIVRQQILLGNVGDVFRF